MSNTMLLTETFFQGYEQSDQENSYGDADTKTIAPNLWDQPETKGESITIFEYNSELESYSQESQKRILRSLTRTDTKSRGSFAQYAD